MLIRHAQEADWQTIAAIEEDNFSLKEAATKSAIKQRTQLISDTFLVAVIDDTIVGYIEGPVIDETDISDCLFHQVSNNSPQGGYIAITSLSIASHYQQQGIGTALLAAMKDLAIAQKREGILLTCHEELIPYYEMNDFQNQGLSLSKHGQAVWYRMLWLANS